MGNIVQRFQAGTRKVVPRGLGSFKGPQGMTLARIMAILKPYRGNCIGARPKGA